MSNRTEFATAWMETNFRLLEALAAPSRDTFESARDSAVDTIKASYGDLETEMAQSLSRLVYDAAAESKCTLSYPLRTDTTAR